MKRIKSFCILGAILLIGGLLVACNGDSGATGNTNGTPDGGVEQPPVGDIYLDAVSGDDDALCTSAKPCRTILRAQELAESGDVVILRPGHYGAFSWDLNGSPFNDWVTWRGEQADDPPQLDSISVRCDACEAYQRFHTLDITLPRVDEYHPQSAVTFSGVSRAEIDRCRITAEQLYPAAAAVEFQGNAGVAHHLTVRRSEIYHVRSGIRFQGTDILIEQNNIHTMPSTMIGCLAGAMSDTDANSAHTVTIRGNHLHDHQGDYPNEDFYDRFDEPAELHSSIIAIRGHHFVIEENEMHNIWDTVGIQLYADDTDGIYDQGHITLRRNLIYDMAPNALQIVGDLDGPIIAEYNTIISSHQDPSWPGSVEPCRRFVNPELSITRQTFNIMEMFEGGEGTIIQNNVLVVDVGIANEAYENYDAPTAHWDLSYNFIYRTAHPSGDVAPSNTLVCEQIEDGTLSANFMDTAVFQSPQYQYQHGQRCGPGLACDFTPLTGSPLCSMGSDGNHVGASPCPLEPSP